VVGINIIKCAWYTEQLTLLIIPAGANGTYN
jgi:hypothetical protein